MLVLGGDIMVRFRGKRNRDAAREGFTLLELLVVVIIIAILAALILANFQLIMTRVRIVRVHSDLRAAAYGMEAFHVDRGRYPDISQNWTLEGRLAQLTTPIAYLHRRLDDPFGQKVDFSFPGSNEYRVYEMVTDVDPYHRLLFEHPFGYGFRQRINSASKYYLVSQGPDEMPNAALGSPWLRFLPYDPTNGTVSSGDIFRSGPGGFLWGG